MDVSFFFFFSLNGTISFSFYHKRNLFYLEKQIVLLYLKYFIFFFQIKKIGFLFYIFIDAFKVGSLYLIDILTFLFKT